MSRRQRAAPEEMPASGAAHVEEEEKEEEEEVQEPPETRRTRSGRKVRTPAALLDSEAPARTPTRRTTRRSALQELKNTEEVAAAAAAAAGRVPESVPEEKLGMSAETEPCADTRAADVNGAADIIVGPAPAGTGPAGTESGPPKKKKPRVGSSEPQKPLIPLGKPKSGRVWKNRNKLRFSAVVRDKPLCSSWEKKMAAKREKDLVKRYSLQLKEDKAKQKEDKRKRREDNLKRRAENERKSEIVQVIRNTAKIKRMKKKQLRKIEKRDTLALLQKSQKQRVKAKGQRSAKVDQDLA